MSMKISLYLESVTIISRIITSVAYLFIAELFDFVWIKLAQFNSLKQFLFQFDLLI